ncbi:hypothetical protein CCR75_001939 [Bremia lactucae]|uniref:Uncharacterized protein n=1 Tax=Bremia lactucae TaxID=4779 RepID=A0A976IGY5_BRELC|nr:hypothetical protein CCR75_001939 [Bremia lactucae]
MARTFKFKCLIKCSRRLALPIDGGAERANRDVLQIAQVVLLEAQLDVRNWDIFLWVIIQDCINSMGNRYPTKVFTGLVPQSIVNLATLRTNDSDDAASAQGASVSDASTGQLRSRDICSVVKDRSKTLSGEVDCSLGAQLSVFETFGLVRHTMCTEVTDELHQHIANPGLALGV